MSKTAIYISAAAVVASLAIAALCSCTRAQGDAAMRLLTMTAESCVRVAAAQGRADIAQACGLTDDALTILQASLADQQCAIPTDAGRD